MAADTTTIKTSKPPRTTPDWATWQQRENCSLKDAVALSLNIHPRALATLKKNGSIKHKNFLTRLKTANLATYKDGPIAEILGHPATGVDPQSRIVSLASFIVFAENQARWRNKLPPEFLLLGKAQRFDQTLPPAVKEEAPAVPDNSSTQVTITLPHMTKTLDALFRIMRDQWSGFNPRRVPKQNESARLIDEALGWNPQKNGEASRNAQVLSAAIRPDHLRESDSRANKRKQ